MPQYPKNELARLLVAGCCHQKIKHVVISPGSRNAPLTIGFTSEPSVKTYSIVDERSAGFFALGLAQQLNSPVALVCTSGSALLNYYPAVSEAFYSNIPLVVISADRPKHLIDIGDGQTIRQEYVFHNHIIYEANLDIEDKLEVNGNKVYKALAYAAIKKGPVHINIPFDEPLYEVVSVLGDFKQSVHKIENEPLTVENDRIADYVGEWNKAVKKLVIVGQHEPDNSLQEILEQLTSDPSVLILIENTANVSHKSFINSIDKLIFPFEKEEIKAFQPDLILSIGGLIVSKKIKKYLREFQPKIHWHVGPFKAFDTFHCLSQHFKQDISTFFQSFLPLVNPVESNYRDYWLQKKAYRLERHKAYLNSCKFSDLKVMEELLQQIPPNRNIQVSNSAVIRYTQLFDIKPSHNVYCNRGTSGIDGSTSTAIGAANAASQSTVFITGDISFFYDSNALWNSYIPNDFRIVLINNGGGGIFRFIPGPKDSNALNYFETPHKLRAEHLCAMHGINYAVVYDLKSLRAEFETFFTNLKGPKLLEICTPREENDLVLKAYFNALKE